MPHLTTNDADNRRARPPTWLYLNGTPIDRECIGYDAEAGWADCLARDGRGRLTTRVERRWGVVTMRMGWDETAGLTEASCT